MIDIHCHILPQIDDGAADWEESLSMAREACRDGIETVVATPHHANGKYLNPAAGVLEQTKLLNEKLREAGIALQVLPGQEIREYANLLDDLERGELLSLALTRYILLEMPSSRIPSRMEEMCHELIIQGYVPIIAHPERNAEIAAHPEKLGRLIEIGALGQLTAISIAGGLGTGLQKLSFDLCERNTVHLIASDAHNCGARPFGLSEAYRLIGKRFGPETESYYRENARKIVGNQPISLKNGLKIKRKRHKIFRLFFQKD